jgi:hypothetical protein
LFKYNAGAASRAEITAIESLIEQGKIQLEEIEGFGKLSDQVVALESPEPSVHLDQRFRQMLKQEKAATEATWWKRFFSWNDLMPRLAFASFTLLIGLLAGYLLRSPEKKDEQISVLSDQIRDMKEMMMLSLLEKESATDRLKAVSLTQDMDHVSKQVTGALLQTLNNDENVNVRLAALDALRPYSKDGQIRAALIRSIAQQKSPLVQVALAELMAELQEKGAIKELNKILQDGETPTDIKKKIQESIQII